MGQSDGVREHLGHNTIQDFIKLSKLLSDNRYIVLKPNTLDLVAILLLAAAINEELFFDVVAWGEHTQLASKATFSRRKDYLEGIGVIYEENVRAPYGRPKIRLMLNEERFREVFKINDEKAE
jgi:hypothetical protein